jgi:hypothetical protein
MGKFSEFFDGFIDGINSMAPWVNAYNQAAANRRPAHRGNGRAQGRLESLLAELDWSVDEREDDGTIRLFFDHARLGRRRVWIYQGDGSLVLFGTCSHAFPKADQVPTEVLGHLLTRNKQMDVGAWSASVDDEGDAIFSVYYRALGDGLDAPALKWICEAMVGEVFAFDTKMQAAGLL